MRTLTVVGAGVAGLAAAVEAVSLGAKVRVIEATNHAGGRARSFDEPTLGLIDNGSHLVLSGNKAVVGLMDKIGGVYDTQAPVFPFLDLETVARWHLKPGLSLLARVNRPPGVSPLSILKDALALIRAPHAATVQDVLGETGRSGHLLWEPLTLGVMNAAPAQAQARALGAVLRQTLLAAPKKSCPLLFPKGLSAALGSPALAWLTAQGTEVCLAKPLKDLEGLSPSSDHGVILALPPTALCRIAPALVPQAYRAVEHSPILNAHFVLDEALPDTLPRQGFLGLVGGLGHWVFWRGETISVTISAAENLMAEDEAHLLDRLWREVRTALALPVSTPRPQKARIIREKRATVRQSPALMSARPATQSPRPHVYLAGDWTDTGLPCTLEGAALSGVKAAQVALNGN